jgi:hypothetical protein
MRTVTISLISILLGIGIGIMIGVKISPKPVIPPCPECPDLIHTCTPAIEVQSLDLDNVRKIKGDFTFSPVYNGDVIMKTDTCK